MGSRLHGHRLAVRAAVVAVLLATSLVVLATSLIDRESAKDVEVKPDPEAAVLPDSRTSERADAGTSSPAPGVAPAGRSLLERAVALGVGDARYLDLEGRAGAWVVTRGDARAPDGLPGALFEGGSAVRVVLPTSLVAGRCLALDASFQRPSSLLVADSLGRKQGHPRPAGRRNVSMGCVPSALAGEFFSVNLRARAAAGSATGAPDIVVHGLLVADEPDVGISDVPRPRRCDGGGGLALRPDHALGFVFMARPGDRVRFSLRGAAPKDVSVLVRTDEGRARELEPVVGPAGRATLELSVKRPRPVELTLDVPDVETENACLVSLGVSSAPAAPETLGTAPVKGVILVLVDTLRADALRLYDPLQGVPAPSLERLAEQSIVFEKAISHSNYTKPSVGTILTGTYPHVHGGLPPMARLDPQLKLLPVMLAEQGVEAVGLLSNHFLNNRKFGFQRGWVRHEQINSYTACLGGEPVAEKLAEMLETWSPDGPFFLYVHLMDPHSPYNPPTKLQIEYVGHPVLTGRFLPKQTSRFIRAVRKGETPPPSQSELAVLRGLYRGDVAHMDVVLGQVVDMLDEAGILDGSLLVVTSDHGEEFMEHGGLGHGTNLYDELVHVPLLVRWPGGGRSWRETRRVGHVDLVPTILDVLDLAPSGSALVGHSLLPLILGDTSSNGHRAYLLEHRNGRERGVVMGPYKLLVRGDRVSMTRLEQGRETRLAPGDHPIAYAVLRSLLIDLTEGDRDDGPLPVEVVLDEQELEKLRSLGYVMN